MNVAIILAGGVGSRLGADRPKQFIEILGKPILVYTLEKFQNNSNIDAIEVVCVESHLSYMQELIAKYNLDKVKWIVKGGKDFQHSVMNGVNNLKNVLTKNDNVVIHFGASPFVSDEIINDSIRVCNEKGNAISTTPFYVLSGIKNEDGSSTQYINRDTIACMSSPHTFNYWLIYNMYDKAVKEKIIETVEPHTTTLMYKMGIPIYFSKGSQTNIKITTKEDLKLFEGYVLIEQQKRETNE